MESTEILVGLDIGTTKVACIVGSKNEYNKIEILGIGRAESLGVQRGVVINIEKTVEAIRSAVEDAEQKSGVDIKTVNVGIAGQHIKSIQHRGNMIRKNTQNEISQEDIESLVDDMFKLGMQPGEEIIDVIAQEYIIDHEPGIKEPIGMAGVSLEANFHIIIGQVSSVQNIIKCIQRSNIEVSDLILEPIASAEAVLSDEEKEAGVVLIDIGGGTTDLAIFHEGIIRHTAVIPFGGNVITEDIKQGCSIIRNQAELLKIKFGSALATENKENEIVSIPGLRGREPKEISLKNLSNIIQARMEEILEHVIYEIKNSGYANKLIAGIVITGGGAQLKHLVQLTEFMTGMDCRIGYPSEHLAKGATDDIASPSFATGVGLVLKGFQQKDKEKAKTKKTNKITTQSNKKPRGSFFEKLFNKTKGIFEDDTQ